MESKEQWEIEQREIESKKSGLVSAVALSQELLASEAFWLVGGELVFVFLAEKNVSLVA